MKFLPTSIFLFFVFISCKKESTENPLLKFTGDFEIKNEHITGLHAVYDSVGNFINYEEQTG